MDAQNGGGNREPKYLPRPLGCVAEVEGVGEGAESRVELDGAFNGEVR